MIKTKESKITKYNDFQISYGTINSNYPDTLYITCKTWIIPSKKISNDNILSIKENLQKKIKETLINSNDFKKKFILDFNFCKETLKIGKKNQLKFEFFLEQNDEVVNFFSLKEKVIKLCDSFINNFSEFLNTYSLSLHNNR